MVVVQKQNSMAYNMKGFSGFKSPIKFKPARGAMERGIDRIERSSKHIAKRYSFINKYGPHTGPSKQKLIDLHKKKEGQIRKKKIDKIKKGQEIAKKINMKIPIIDTPKPKLKKQGTKRVVKKVIGKLASRAVPYAGWALAASDAFGIGKKMYRGASFKEAAKKQFL